MMSSAAAEQQTKLGVSAEESKVQRIKRQHARFRDRGGVFVPSDSNPLVHILLARTVSGESPSKACPKDVTAKRPSSVKARRTPTRKARITAASDESQVVVGNAKSELAFHKRKEKAPEPGDLPKRPSLRRRGRPAKGEKKAQHLDFGTGQPHPIINSKPKVRNKRRDPSPVPSSSEPNVKPKPKARAKPTLVKAVVEALVSDDDRTLVEAPLKVKTKLRRNMKYEGDCDVDDGAQMARKPRPVLPPIDNMQEPGTEAIVGIKEENAACKRRSAKEMEEEEMTTQTGECLRSNATRQLVPHGDICDQEVIRPIAKEKKTSTAKGRGRILPHRGSAESAEEVGERPPERPSNPQKRKKEDNHNHRPRKAVKFTDASLPISSSKSLKENQSGTHRTNTMSTLKDDSHVPPSRPAANPPSRIKRSKGPPREVLERIKASTEQYLQCPDNEPDELDCLS